MTGSDGVSGQKVVVVDDDELAIELVRRHLRKTPHELVSFLCEEAGLEYLLAEPPSVLLIDQRLPKMDGLDILHQLATADKLAGVKAFLCSAVELPEPDREAADALHVSLVTKDMFGSRERFLEVTGLLR